MAFMTETPSPISLRRIALRATYWIAAATAVCHMLKLGSSLVLTRLLFPEAFGLVATAGLLSAAVDMCSDLGIVQAIIQHREGNARRFLDGAWTMRVVRGWALGLIIAAVAWPFARFFDELMLFPIALVTAVGAVLRGFTSPAIFLWERNLELNRRMTWEMGSDLFRVAATIVLTLWLRSVWGLVWGGFTGEVGRLAGSFLLGRYRPRFSSDTAAMKELFLYGRFILLSSLLGFAASRLDMVMVAKFLGMERAGVYQIAITLAMMLTVFFRQLAGQVLFPVLSRRQDDPAALRSITDRAVSLTGTVVLPAVALLAVNADVVPTLLYDPRYADAAGPFGWFCAAAGLMLLADTLNAPLMATGRPHYATIAIVLQLVLVCVAAPMLGRFFGVSGYAAGVALATAGSFCAILVPCKRLGFVSVGPALASLAVPTGVAATARALRELAPSGLIDSSAGMGVLLLELGLLAVLWLLNWANLRALLPVRNVKAG